MVAHAIKTTLVVRLAELGARGRIDSFVSDVSGHGVGAALLMSEARITFLTDRLAEPGAARILSKMNKDKVLHDGSLFARAR